MDAKVVTKSLDACLLTDEELSLGRCINVDDGLR